MALVWVFQVTPSRDFNKFYGKLRNTDMISNQRKSPKTPLFYVALVVFVAFFGAAGFILYQNQTKPFSSVSPGSAEKLAELYLVGGIAGFCDHLTVFEDGSALVINDCSGEQKDFQVEVEVFEQLKSFAMSLAPFTYNHNDNLGGPDDLSTKLVFFGRKSTANQPNKAQRDNVFRLVSSILSQSRL